MISLIVVRFQLDVNKNLLLLQSSQAAVQPPPIQWLREYSLIGNKPAVSRS